MRANPNIRSPRHLKIGDILIIPAPAKAAKPSKEPETREVASAPSGAGSSAPTATKSYRVQKGDTFYSIAQKMLGSSTRWKEVYDRNRAVVKNDPKRLKPGMVLTLPG